MFENTLIEYFCSLKLIVKQNDWKLIVLIQFIIVSLLRYGMSNNKTVCFNISLTYFSWFKISLKLTSK